MNVTVQFYVNDVATPIDDLSVSWNVPNVSIATLFFPAQNVWDSPIKTAMCEATTYHPWQVNIENKPVGEFQDLRRIIYGNQQALRRKLQHQRQGDWTSQTLRDYVNDINSLTLLSPTCFFSSAQLSDYQHIQFTLAGDGNCGLFTATPALKRAATFVNSTGGVVRFSVSVTYRRVAPINHHEGNHRVESSSSSSSDVEKLLLELQAKRCGPRITLRVENQVVYKNDETLFELTGVVSGSVEVQLANGNVDMSLSVVADHCKHHELHTMQPTIEASVLGPLSTAVAPLPPSVL